MSETLQMVERSFYCSQSPQTMLESWQGLRRINEKVFTAMPKGVPQGTLLFFPGGETFTPVDLQREYNSFSLAPHPWALIKVNTDNPSFADRYPNAVQWLDENGDYCFISFIVEDDMPQVTVDRVRGLWHNRWSYGGVSS